MALSERRPWPPPQYPEREVLPTPKGAPHERFTLDFGTSPVGHQQETRGAVVSRAQDGNVPIARRLRGR